MLLAVNLRAFCLMSYCCRCSAVIVLEAISFLTSLRRCTNTLISDGNIPEEGEEERVIPVSFTY